MSAHTPAPWFVEHKGLRVLSDDKRATIVCDVTGTTRNPQSVADANLIAAAPELLQAAMDAYELLKLIHDEAGKVGTQLRAAIAKAKGESV
jgi:hypothetical protein